MERSQHPLSQPWWPAAALVACLLQALASAPLTAERTAADLEQEEFLREARIERTRTIPVGVTLPLRATLSDGRLTHDAHIQTIDVRYRQFRTEKRSYFNFRDSYHFNIAGYRLDRLVGLNMVPVSVERRFRSKKAAFTWWVDDVLMMDSERHQQGIEPPDLASWNDQMHQARVFHQLIYNADINLSNFLITSEWRLWMIDFTRAFRSHRELPEPELLRRIDRRLYRGLQGLTLEALRQAVGRHLGRRETEAVMARRDAILEIFAARIAAHSEAAVICDRPGH